MNSAVELASRRRRLFATAIDAILVPTLTIFLVMVAGVVEDAEDYRDNSWMFEVLIIAVVSYLLLNGFTLWRSGQTLGKKLVGIRIVRHTPGQSSVQPAPLWKLICIRALFFPFLFTLPLPWLTWLPLLDQLLIFRKDRRCLHDLASQTDVIRLNANPGNSARHEAT